MVAFSSLYGTRLDRELGNDDRTQLFTVARRQGAINEGAVEFANLTGALTRWAGVPVVNGQQEYDLNSTTVIAAGDFGGFAKESVEYIETVTASSFVTVLSGPDQFPRKDVPWLDQYRPNWQASTQNSSIRQLPQVYYVRMDGGAYNLGLFPTPSAGTLATAVLSVPYLADAPTMTSDADEPFTFAGSPRADLSAYHQALVHYGAHQLEKLRRDDEASDRQLQKFIGYVSRYLQDTARRGPKVVRQMRNYFSRRTK